MPRSNKRNISQATQYVCSECEYITFDSGNRIKHRRVHGGEDNTTPRRITYGTPDLPKNESTINANQMKQFFYARHVCPYTPDGLVELMKKFTAPHAHELMYGRSVIRSMKLLFDATWARDTYDHTKPCKFRNIVRCNKKLYWYRTTCGFDRTIDDFSIFEMPDNKESMKKLTYELFRLLRDIYYWSATTDIKEFRLPYAIVHWNNNPLKGLDEKICGSEVTSYQSWMQPVADELYMYISPRVHVIRDFEPAIPAVYELDTDAPSKRRVKVFACPWCKYSSITRQGYMRHNLKCKKRIQLYKDLSPPYTYRVAWYLDDEVNTLHPFTERTTHAVDVLNERSSHPVSRSSYIMTKLTPEQRERLVLPPSCEKGSRRIDEAILACFDLMYGKNAVLPELQSCVVDGRFAYTEIAMNGKRVVRRVIKDTVLLRNLCFIKALLGQVNSHQYQLFLAAFASTQFEVKTKDSWERYSYDDIIDLTCTADDQIEMDVIDSTSDKAYKKSLDISEDLRDVCKLATKMIPSDTEFVNYIGQLD